MTNLVYIDVFLRSRLELEKVSFHARKRCWDIFKGRKYSQVRKFGGSKQILMLQSCWNESHTALWSP